MSYTSAVQAVLGHPVLVPTLNRRIERSTILISIFINFFINFCVFVIYLVKSVVVRWKMQMVRRWWLR